MIIIAAILVILSLLLAWGTKSRVIWRIVWINSLVILIYSMAGWYYIFSFMSGGESLGPGLMLTFFILVHIGILFVATVIMAMTKASRDQSG